MKFFAVLAAAAFAVVSAQDAPCDTSKLAPLLQDASLVGCRAESGLTFPPSAVPTAEQIKKACAVKDCGDLVAKVQATGLTTCKLGPVDLIKDMLEPIAKECKFDAAAAPAKNETAPAKPETQPAGSHAGSHAGAKEDVVAPAGSAAGSKVGGAKDDVKAPNKDTPAPTPAKTSSASSAAAAAGAAVVAVAAALL
ncbi:hypothetical protein P43SY_009483 [Pythium insidiosum]|uniref:Elicitin n=1 Tax=Pythium insidiosum TaxID=114742 RepID=A0AAD5L7A5_PYTIN|nr:hypothetical protein P43SY_009483 [Pythium insidiosum]